MLFELRLFECLSIGDFKNLKMLLFQVFPFEEWWDRVPWDRPSFERVPVDVLRHSPVHGPLGEKFASGSRADGYTSSDDEKEEVGGEREEVRKMRGRGKERERARDIKRNTKVKRKR